MTEKLKILADTLHGKLHFDKTVRAIYATDASVYKEYPLAVCLPETIADIKKVIHFVSKYKLSIIPRAAGTSLAGQCVGDGIVVDISKMNRILDVNVEESWVRVQPGVVRDELNAFLKPLGLFFGPNTSTANRCMMGGMVGNNSCGTTSIVYGSTREHTIALELILSDGSQIKCETLNKSAFDVKRKKETLEGQLYQHIFEELSIPEQQKEIKTHFPKDNIHRRNTGYAVDLLLKSNVFTEGGEDFNFCKLLCGSEGTLAFTTAMKLHVDPLPPAEDVVLCAHFETMNEAMEAVVLTMKHQPSACELMDDTILQLSKQNREQQKNRFFINGDPAAILCIEFRAETKAAAEAKVDKLIEDFVMAKYGYAFPKVFAPQTKAVWDLRKAGLGILANLPGDAKAVACIEDTAVDIEDLPAYIAEFSAMMTNFGQEAVYYAHAGAGEIHLRPILDLKVKKDRQLFYDISKSTAELVKRYNGSLSGEHGDGRVRAAFIPLMLGDKNYELLCRVKQTWDKQNIFNPGKIVEAAPMNTSLRYDEGQKNKAFDTLFDFSATGNMLGAIEKCNGSGDCRKSNFAEGTMCPSYRATRDEKDSTRGRANALREFLSKNDAPNPFDQRELYDILDLCLSCKACASECPSNVDMAKLKAEFLHQYYKTNRIPFRTWFFTNAAKMNAFGGYFPRLSNFFLQNKFTSDLLKKVIGISPQRKLPLLHTTTLYTYFKKRLHLTHLSPARTERGKTLYLFCDEVTNFNDTPIGIKALELLTYLGYEIKMLPWTDSGRVHISKGLIAKAKVIAGKNVALFHPLISREVPLIGIEPSGILGFRDEYPSLLRGDLQKKAKALSPHTFTIEEFLYDEMNKGNISSTHFTKEKKHILLHGHCHQKSLSSQEKSALLLSLPQNYTVEIISSGCCGMAGAFGFEKEHYELSQKVGEMVLFPAVKNAKEDTLIAASGASCRQQIKEGTMKEGLHIVEILWRAIFNT